MVHLGKVVHSQFCHLRVLRFRRDLNLCLSFCRRAPRLSATEPFEESRGLEPHPRGGRRFSKPEQLHSYFTLQLAGLSTSRMNQTRTMRNSGPRLGCPGFPYC